MGFFFSGYFQHAGDDFLCYLSSVKNNQLRMNRNLFYENKNLYFGKEQRNG